MPPPIIPVIPIISNLNECQLCGWINNDGRKTCRDCGSQFDNIVEVPIPPPIEELKDIQPTFETLQVNEPPPIVVTPPIIETSTVPKQSGGLQLPTKCLNCGHYMCPGESPCSACGN